MPLTRRTRRREQNNRNDINGGRHRSLNDLPDNVLTNIISFLPTKDAVRTSILSQRWEFIWTTIPELSFVQENAETETFMNFVKRALSLRGSSKITKFQLVGKMDTSLSVETVISSVAECNVEEFELHLEDIIREALTLPLKLLNSATLAHLNIRMQRGQKLILPFLIWLPSLKLLNLQDITFPNQHSAQNLFYGCPVLENLQLVNCKWVDVKTLRVPSSKLQKLGMFEDHDGQQQNGENRPEFVILGSGLRHFTYVGLLYFDYCFMNPVPLEEVNVYTYDASLDENQELIANHLLKLLRSVSHAPTLMLAHSTVSLLLSIPEAVKVPMFLGVRLLRTDINSSDFSNARLLRLLESTPCLESLVFRGGLMMPSNPIEDDILDPVPACFLNHLHYVFVHVYHGDDVDLVGIRILLKNAKVLRKMEILLGLFVTPNRRINFPLELLKVPRASKDCGIYVL